MAHRGQVIENAALKERITFLTTARDSGGEVLVFDDVVGPGNPGPPKHYHPRQDEWFEVRRGRVRVLLGAEERELGPGERVFVPRGVAHTFRVVGDEEASLLTEFRPAGDVEGWLESVFALAREGKVRADGAPKPLAIAPIAHAHLDDFVFAGPPVALQRLLLALVAPVARLLGNRADYRSEPLASPPS